MIGVIARKLFGSSNERRIKGYLPRVGQINALEKELEGLSDEGLRARTEAFKRQVAEGASLDDILVPAARRRNGPWGNGTSTFSSSAA
jgi:preprotein translocase subunit SecA